MCLQWSVGVALSCIAIVFIQNADGQDGTLTCPATWYEGVRVELICTMDKFFRTDCSNETAFINNGNTYCTVASGNYSSCLDAADTTRPAGKFCWCLKNSTDYIFKYAILPDREKHNGTWTCNKKCQDPNFGTLYFTQIANCSNVKVQAPLCDISTSKCNQVGAQSCFLDDNQEVKCLCKKEYTNDDCSEKINTNKDTVIGLAVGLGVVGLVAVGAIVIAVIKSLKAYNERRVPVPAKIVADGNSETLKEKLKADIVDDYFQRSQPVYFGTKGPPKSIQEVIILSQDTKELEDAKTKVSNIIKAYSDGKNASKVSATSTVAKHTTTDEGKRKRKNKKKSTKVGEELTTINQKSPPESAA